MSTATETSSNPTTAAPVQMPFMEHIRELRSRFLKAMFAIIVCSIVAFTQYDRVQDWLLVYYREAAKDLDIKFLTFGPVEGLATRTKISSYIGLFAACPIWLWQIWAFVNPALNKKERRYAVPFIISSVVLFIGGAIMALITLPAGLSFLIDFGGKGQKPAYNTDKMTSLVTLMVLGFGFAFLFPVFLVFLQLVRVLKSERLFAVWRYAIVGIFVAAAVITPSQDPISFIAMAGPMVVFYFAAAWIGKLLGR
jgi:sec-independent protein translocase protein TatC